MKNMLDSEVKTIQAFKTETKEQVQSEVKHVADKIEGLEAQIIKLIGFAERTDGMFNWPHAQGAEEHKEGTEEHKEPDQEWSSTEIKYWITWKN